ncbi:hypothetical protein OGATHE_001889 [Ogataea polymorpha]|uniref:Uncharacterized protein n=1 Tax=Ogataea polymorpha TaxID=460523 RepID=A0A9P8TCP7_9ASCO|nr:hypothetical protein OGATHE_001889 [Ogataea polymorpha]
MSLAGSLLALHTPFVVAVEPNECERESCPLDCAEFRSLHQDRAADDDDPFEDVGDAVIDWTHHSEYLEGDHALHEMGESVDEN